MLQTQPLSALTMNTSASSTSVCNFPAEPDENSPTAFLRSLFPGRRRVQAAMTSRVTDEYLEGYNMVTVRAIRENDLEQLRELVESGRSSLTACNRNGESLLHLACRRGNLDVVKYMIESGVDVSFTDDLGRTCLHDVCWRPEPDFELMEVLLHAATPDQLLQEDRRGHTCFDYCRKQHWEQWTEFLQKHATKLQRKARLLDLISGSQEN